MIIVIKKYDIWAFKRCVWNLKMRTPKVRVRGGKLFWSIRPNDYPIDPKSFWGGLEHVWKRFRGGHFCFFASKIFFRIEKLKNFVFWTIRLVPVENPLKIQWKSKFFKIENFEKIQKNDFCENASRACYTCPIPTKIAPLNVFWGVLNHDMYFTLSWEHISTKLCLGSEK